jgi:hypothetical protein
VTLETCTLSPFVAKVVAQKGSLEDAASALAIFIRQLEGYLRELKAAICTDLQSSTGVSRFIQLLDVPNSYVGQGTKIVRVNSLETGLEFFAQSLVTAFIDLSDVPHSYASQSLKGVRVNAGETGLEFYLRSLIGLSDFPASYTSQALKALRVNAGATAVEFFTQALTLLSDFPASYSGAALKFLRVNAGATAVEFITAALTLMSDFPASYSGQALKILRVNAGETAVEFHSEAFVDLADVPASYSGAASKIVAVNAAATGLEFLNTTASDLTFIITPSLRWSVWGGGGVQNPAGFASLGAESAVTSASFPAIATTNLLTSTARLRSTGSAGAGNAANIRSNVAIVWRGNAAGLGGFRCRARFASSTALAQQRGFVGLCATIGAVIPNGQPSAFVNVAGFGYDAAETNWSTIVNDNTGTATKTSLGAGYPVDATSVFEITLIAQPNASSIDWTISNIGSGASTSGSFTTDLPVNTTLMSFQLWINNGTTASAAVLECPFAVVTLY